MLKSVWLTDLIVSELNDAGSVPAPYFRHVSALLGTRLCELCLCEPDGGGMIVILIADGTACISPLSGIGCGENALRAAMSSRGIVKDGDVLCAPLYFGKVSAFGALCCRDAACCGGEELLNALQAFSAVLYSEAMGSIIKSFHPTALQVENVSVDYRNGRLVNRAVNNASFEICEKEFTVIAGASGSGKSSLLNVMGGMLRPCEGHVWWKGTDIARMSEKKRTAYRASAVGFVFQHCNLISDLTAEENVRVAASLVKNPMRAAEALEMVGLSGKAGSYPSALSGGEQQRVCIARALVKHAGILLCDEPTGALDTENAGQIIRVLKTISKEKGIPVVVITHNPDFVPLGDHCLTISNGTVSKDIFQPYAPAAE